MHSLLRRAAAPVLSWRRAAGRLALWAALALGLAALNSPAQLVGPSNDYFTNAWLLPGESGTTNSTGEIYGNIAYATYEAGEPRHWIYNGPDSVWFRWDATNASGYVLNNGIPQFQYRYITFDTRGSTFDTVLAVYRYPNLAGTNATLALLNMGLYGSAANDDYNPPGSLPTNHYSQVTILAESNMSYYVAVASYGGSSYGYYRTSAYGTYTLNWNLSDNFTNAAPTFSEFNFSTTDYSTAENTPGYATITVVYNNTNSSRPVSVDYATAPGSARAGIDYLHSYGTLTFLPGESVKTFTVPVIDNAMPNTNKTVRLSLLNPSSGAVLGAQRFATLTIVDDETVAPPDVAGQFQFSSLIYRVTDLEGSWMGTFDGNGDPAAAYDSSRFVLGALITVTRSAPAVGRVLVDFQTTNKFNPTNLFGGLYSYTSYYLSGVGLTYYYSSYLYVSSWISWLALPVVPGEPGYDYYPTNGTLVFDDHQMSASFVVPLPDNYGTIYGTGYTNVLAAVDLLLSNPRPAPEENPALIRPSLGPTNEASLYIVGISAGTASTTTATNATAVSGFSLARAHYRVNEFGRREFNITNVSRVSVAVVIPTPHAQGSVNVVVRKVDSSWTGSSIFGQIDAASDYADDSTVVYPNSTRTDGSEIVINPRDFVSADFNLDFGPTTYSRSFTIAVTNDSMVEFNEDFEIVLYALPNNPPLGPNRHANVTILYDDQPPGAVDREWNPDMVSYSTPPYNHKPGANNVVYAVAVAPDKRTIIGGDFTGYNGASMNRVARLLDNGFLDTSFHIGVGADNSVLAVTLYPPGDTNGNNGRVLLGGSFSSFNGVQRNGVARLNPDGSLDTSFRPGFGANGPVRSIVLQQDGKILVAGEFTVFNGQNLINLARLNNDGSVDLTFNPGWGADGPIYALAVLDAATNIFTARAGESNVITDINVVQMGVNTASVMTVEYDFPVQNNIQVVYEQNILLNMTLTGRGFLSLTNGFGGGVSTQVKILINEGLTGYPGRWSYTATILPVITNRLIYVAGDFAAFDGFYRPGVARLGPDGAVDPWFDPGSGANKTVWSMAVQPDGKILLGGAFTDFDFHSVSGIVRLNPSGAVDESFGTGGGFDGPVYSIAMQPDMKPVVGGGFTEFNMTRRIGVARLFSNGALDTGFLDTAFNQFAGLSKNFSFENPGYVNAVALEDGGNVYIGGFFTNKLGGNAAFEVNNVWQTFPCWTRADKTDRCNIARLIGTWGTIPITVIQGTNTNVVIRANGPQGPGNLDFVGGSYATDEGAGELSVSLRRLDGRLGTAYVSLASSNRTALAGVHYEGVNTNVVWPEDFYTTNFYVRHVAMPTPRQVGCVGFNYLAVPIIDERLIEGDHTFDIGMFRPEGRLQLGGEIIPLAAAMASTAARVAIIENDVSRGTFVFEAPAYGVNKSAGLATIYVVRTNGSANLVTVDYFTVDDSPFTTATSDRLGGGPPDYRSTLGTLTFGPGVTRQSFTVPILNNTQVSFDKTIQIVLTNAAGGATLPGGLPTSTTATLLTIVDDNYLPGRVNFTSSGFITNESARFARITASRTGGSLGDVRVTASTYPAAASAGGVAAVAGSNYTDTSTVLVWTNLDSAPKSFYVPLINDGRVTGTLLIGLSLSNPRVASTNAPQLLGNRTNALLTVTDSDSYGNFSFSEAEYFVDENGGPATFNVVRRNHTVGWVTVDFSAQAGTGGAEPDLDFAAVQGTLVFAPGDISKAFPVDILDNSTMEGYRDFFVVLSQPVVVTNPASFNTNSSVYRPLKTYGIPIPVGAGGLAQPNPARVTITDDESYANPAGSLDVAFNENSAIGADAPVYALAMAPGDDRLIMAGDFHRVNSVRRNSIARLNSDATLDGIFNTGTGADGAIRAMAVQDDGRVLVGGAFTSINSTNRSHIARLSRDGSLDIFFNPGSGMDGDVSALVIQPDGLILAAGSFSRFNGQAQPYIVRLNTNGTINAGFNVGNGPDGPVLAVALQPDGKILIGGDFRRVNDDPAYCRVARLLPDGRLDTSFRPGAGADNTVRAIVVQNDGRVILGGSFTNFDGTSVNRITRLHADGSLDTSYMAGVTGAKGADGVVYTLAMLPDGKLLAAGGFTRFNGVYRRSITRLTSEGATDPSINFGSGANGFIAALLVQPDRKIIIGGGFTEVQGRPRLRVARLHGGALSGSGRFQFSAARYDVNAGDGFGLVTVQRQGGSFGSNITVHAATADATATAGVDYLPVSTNLVFPEGEVFSSFVVSLTNGHFFGGSRAVQLSLSGAPLGDQPNATLNIYSEDCRIGFQTASYSIARDAQSGFAPITIVRTDSSNSVVRVNFAISPGTNSPAFPGVDYVDVTNYNILAFTNSVLTNGSWLVLTNYATNYLEFRKGEMSKVVLVPLIATNGGRGDRLASLVLSNAWPTNIASLAISNATLAILDDVQPAGVLAFSTTNYFVLENAGTASIKVIRRGGSSGAVSVGYLTLNGTARAGSDYTPQSGFLGFDAGETEKYIQIPVKDNAVPNADRTVLLVLHSPAGGAGLDVSNAVLNIQEYLIDTNYFVFGSTNFFASETDPFALISVHRTNNTRGTAYVGFAVRDGSARSGQNYVATNGVLEFPEGENVRRFAVPLLHDRIGTSNLQFTVELTSAWNISPGAKKPFIAQTNSLVTLTNVDTSLRLAAAAYSVAENATNLTITVLRDGLTNSAASVSFSTVDGGSAVAGLHYVPTNGTLSWGSNDVTPRTFVLRVIDDSIVNPDRTVFIALTNGAGPETYAGVPSNIVVTIVNDDLVGPSSGDLDPIFNSSFGANDTVFTAGFDSAGRIYAGGAFTYMHGVPAARFARLAASGALDLAFETGAGFDQAVYAYALAEGGAVAVGGAFTNYNNTAQGRLALLDTNGAVLPQFRFAKGADAPVRALVFGVLPQLDYTNSTPASTNGVTTLWTTNSAAAIEGTASISWFFAGLVDTNTTTNLVALVPVTNDLALYYDGAAFFQTNIVVSTTNPVSGSFRAAFGPGNATDVIVAVNALFPNGRPWSYSLTLESGSPYSRPLLVGGEFATIDSVPAQRIALLMPNGQPNAAFQRNAGGANDTVYALAAWNPSASNTFFYVAGNFTSIGRDSAQMTRVARLFADGRLDYSFLTGYGPNAAVRSLAVEPDGRLLIAGEFTSVNGVPRNHVARLMPDGSVDLSFDPGDGASGPLYSVARQSDGLILVGGQFTDFDGNAYSGYARLFPDGSVDTALDVRMGAAAQPVVRAVAGIAAIPAAQAVVGVMDAYMFPGGTNTPAQMPSVGETNILLSFTAGVLHLGVTNFPTYTQLGPVVIPLASPVEVYYGTTLLFSNNLSGSNALDLAFNGAASNLLVRINRGLTNGPVWIAGWTVDPGANLVDVPSKTLIAGEFTKVGPNERRRIALLSGDSLLDGAFYPFGGFHTVVNALGLYTNSAQPQLLGRVLAGGDFSVLVGGTPLGNYARLNVDGTLDQSFYMGAGADKAVRAVIVQPDGKALIAGAFTTVDLLQHRYVARLGLDGYPERDFNKGAGPNGPVDAMALQFGTNILIAGEFTSVYGSQCNRIARLSPLTGAVDPTFYTGAGANAAVRALAVLADGRMLVGGDFTAFNNQTARSIARLSASGAFDSSFLGLNLLNGPVFALAVQSDGRILAGGSFTVAGGGRVYVNLARFEASGALDATFAESSPDASVIALRVESGNKILVGGAFTTFNGQIRNRFARLTAEGALDASIDTGLGANNVVNALAFQPFDGNVIVGGAFTEFDGQVRVGLARVFDGANSGSGQFRFSAAEYSVSENGTNAVLFLQRTGGASNAVSVEFFTANGAGASGALAGQDYVATAGRADFRPGESFQVLTIPLVDNSVINTDKAFTVALRNPAGAALGQPASARVLIQDNECAVGFRAAYYSVAEGSNSIARITVERQGGLSDEFSVDYSSTTNGTAVAGIDYLLVPGTLIFRPGINLVSFDVLILDNSISAFNPTVELILSNATAPAVLVRSNALLTIVNDDLAPGTFAFSTNNFVVDEVGVPYATITVIRTNGYSGAVSVKYETANGSGRAGVNYRGVSGLLNFADGETNKTFLVPILDDFALSGDKTVLLLLKDAGNGASIGGANSVLTIREGDSAGRFEFTASVFSVSEDSTNALVYVRRAGGTLASLSNTVTVVSGGGSAIAGRDYVSVSNLLVFTNGETVKSVRVPLISSAGADPTRSVDLRLERPTDGATLGVPSLATLLILDTQTAFTFSLTNYTVSETGRIASITVLRYGNTNASHTVNFATGLPAGAPAWMTNKFIATNGVLFFGKGQTNQSFDVQILDETLTEGDATILLTLSSPSGGASLGPVFSATLSILEDDSLFDFSSPAYSVYKSATNVFITIVRRGNTNNAASVNFTTTDESAVSYVNYFPAAGVVAFAPGQLSNTVPIFLLNPGGRVGDKSLLLTLYNATNALNQERYSRLYILDDTKLVAFSTNLYWTASKASNALVTLLRQGPADGELSVTLMAAGGTAVRGTDYASVSNVVRWTNGDSAPKTVPIRILDDGLITGVKSLGLFLTNAPGVLLPLNGGTLDPLNFTATLYIVDDAGALSLFATDLTLSEDSTNQLIFIRTGGTNGAVSVDYSLSGGTNGVDYPSDLVTVAFGHGVTVQTNYLRLLHNPALTGARTFTLALTNARGGAMVGSPAQATLRIRDVDAGLVIPVGVSILAENKTANNIIDQGETVTISIGLRNEGGQPAAEVSGLLLAGTNYTLLPAAAYQSNRYGALVDGSVVSRSYTFTAGSGSQINLPFAITQPGPNGRLTNLLYTFNFLLGSNSLAFANRDRIVINDNAPASPFPSIIRVDGTRGPITNVSVTLFGLTHSSLSDVDVLLVSPDGQTNSMIMSDVGGSSQANLTVTLSDSAALTLPQSATITNGLYKPTNYGAVDNASPPAPSGAHGASLAVFNGLSGLAVNGDWKLYVWDDSFMDSGSLEGGWSLSLQSVDILSPVADLAVEASSAQAVLAGSIVTNRFTVWNNGPANVSRVFLTNTIPANAVVLRTNGVPVANGSTRLIVFDLGAMPLGKTNVITVAMQLNGPGLAASGAQAASPFAVEAYAENNFRSIATTVYATNAVADLGLSLLAAPSVPAGAAFTYTLVATNLGPVAATNAFITHVLPEGFTCLSASLVGQDGKARALVISNASRVDATLPVLSNAASASILIRGSASLATSSLLVSASVSADTTDMNLANNSFAAAIAVTVARPPLPAPVISGGKIRFDWSANPSFYLEESPTLNPPAWSRVSAPGQVTFEVAAPYPGPSRFYRLRFD